MKKLLTCAMVFCITIAVIFGMKSKNAEAETNYDFDLIPGYGVVFEEVSEFENVEEAEEAVLEKAVQNNVYNDISMELATLHKTKNSPLRNKYVSIETINGNDVAKFVERNKSESHSSNIESNLVYAGYDYDENTVEFSIKKTCDDERITVSFEKKGEVDMFHPFKLYNGSDNLFFRNGSDLYTVDKEKGEFIQLADDYFTYFFKGEDGKYYYINNEFQLVDESGKVLAENVYGADGKFGTNRITFYK